jgi:hypothetical protein
VSAANVLISIRVHQWGKGTNAACTNPLVPACMHSCACMRAQTALLPSDAARQCERQSVCGIENGWLPLRWSRWPQRALMGRAMPRGDPLACVQAPVFGDAVASPPAPQSRSPQQCSRVASVRVWLVIARGVQQRRGWPALPRRTVGARSAAPRTAFDHPAAQLLANRVRPAQRRGSRKRPRRAVRWLVWTRLLGLLTADRNRLNL